MTIVIRRRKSKKERAMRAAGDAAKKLTKIRLSWAAAKTAGKVAVPAAALAAGAAIVKRRSGSSGPPTAAPA